MVVASLSIIVRKDALSTRSTVSGSHDPVTSPVGCDLVDLVGRLELFLFNNYSMRAVTMQLGCMEQHLVEVDGAVLY